MLRPEWRSRRQIGSGYAGRPRHHGRTVPEPGSLALCGIGAAGQCASIRREEEVNHRQTQRHDEDKNSYLRLSCVVWSNWLLSPMPSAPRRARRSSARALRVAGRRRSRWVDRDRRAAASPWLPRTSDASSGTTSNYIRKPSFFCASRRTTRAVGNRSFGSTNNSHGSKPGLLWISTVRA